jgi:hypothetical protein
MTAPNWSPDEDDLLTKLWQDNVPAAEIARQLPGRTEGAVSSRALKLDLPLRASFKGCAGPLSRRRYDLEDE